METSPENLRLRLFAAGRCSVRLATDRVCAPARPWYRAPVAEAKGQVIGLAEYDAAETAVAVADRLRAATARRRVRREGRSVILRDGKGVTSATSPRSRRGRLGSPTS